MSFSIPFGFAADASAAGSANYKRKVLNRNWLISKLL
jgi:hypothetical protein